MNKKILRTKIFAATLGVVAALICAISVGRIQAQNYAPPAAAPSNNVPQVIYPTNSGLPRTGNQVKNGVLGVEQLLVDSGLANQTGSAAIPPTGTDLRATGISYIASILTGAMSVTALPQVSGTTPVCTDGLGNIGLCQQTPTAPTVSLMLNGQNVSSATFSGSSSATLSWQSTGATVCSGSFSGTVGASGSTTVNVTQTTTYTITCYAGPGLSGASASDSLTITLAPPVTPTVDLRVNGAQSATYQSTGNPTLSWTTTQAGYCSAPWTSSHATADSQVLTAVTSTTTYNITCYSSTTASGPSATDSVTVTITQPPIPSGSIATGTTGTFSSAAATCPPTDTNCFGGASIPGNPTHVIFPYTISNATSCTANTIWTALTPTGTAVAALNMPGYSFGSWVANPSSYPLVRLDQLGLPSNPGTIQITTIPNSSIGHTGTNYTGNIYVPVVNNAGFYQLKMMCTGGGSTVTFYSHPKAML